MRNITQQKQNKGAKATLNRQGKQERQLAFYVGDTWRAWLVCRAQHYKEEHAPFTSHGKPSTTT